MKNKGIRIIYIVIFFSILLLILCSRESYDGRGENELCKEYEKVENFECKDIYTKENEYYKKENLIEFDLKKSYIEEKKLVIKARCQKIDVYIDNEKVYENEKITSSNILHTVLIKPEHFGKKVKIVCKNSSNTKKEMINGIYYGDYVSIEVCELRHNILELIFIVLEITFGIICIGLFLLEGKNDNEKEIYLGGFLILFAIWSLLDLGVMQMFLGKIYFFDILKIIIVFLMTFLFLLFEKAYYLNVDKMKKSYKYMMIFGIILTICCGYIVLCSNLKFSKEMIVHGFVVCFISISSFLFIYEKTRVKESYSFSDKKHKNTIKKSNFKRYEKYIRLSIILVFIPYIIDILFEDNIYMVRLLRFFCINDYLVLKIGIIIYMLLILVDILEHVRKMIIIGKKAIKLEQLAKKDVLTQANSRTSYTEFIKKINKDRELCNNKMIVSFDVNDLKLINDNYGHDAGDAYLIKCADIIKQAFNNFGESYRIGGDEFIVIIDNYDKKRFEDSKEKLKILQQNCIRREDNKPISIAYGYAKFDNKLDNNILDTVKRADAMMYRRKNKIKKGKK